jgi:cobalt-zinc-cadmium efflux system protein
MGAGHDHGQQYLRAGARHRGRLWAAFGVLAAFMVAEVVAGLWSGSLALLSDAGHMFTDVLGIGMALAAIQAASMGTRKPGRTFGLYRLEVLAALANTVLLFAVATYVLVEAVRRFASPQDVLAGPMLAVAVAGLGANLVAFWLLRTGAKESLNVQGAYLEVLADALGSVGVIVAALVIQFTGWQYADPIIAVAVGAMILPRTWRLGRQAVRILVQAAPKGLDMATVARDLTDIEGVIDVHDVHVWTLTSGMDVASAHLTIRDESALGLVLASAQDRLHERYGIDHATLQVEPVGADPGCRGVAW